MGSYFCYYSLSFKYMGICLAFSFGESIMKRSDMVKIIASDLIREELGLPDWSIAQNMAEIILKTVEDCMQPRHPGGDLAGILEEGEWEPEDKLKMIILVGFPGSGKSTWASHLTDYVVINQDTLGNRQRCIDQTKRCLKDGRSVIIDRTNINRKQRSIWTNIAKEFKIDKIECIELRIKPELAIERITKRENHPTIKNGTPIEKIRDIVRRFVNEYQEPRMDEGFNRIDTIHIDNLC